MACTPSGGLAATLIVRNEARCITRCLESVRPWVDRLVVVDTGSTDETVALAKHAGAEVHGIAWPDDFAAARNQALALADADWNLILDADEWIVSGGGLLRAWCRGAARLGRVCQNNSSDVAVAPGQPLPASRAWVTRIVPRGVRYTGRIHEQVASTLPRERIDLHLGHDGYLKPQLATKSGRNQVLLERDLLEWPDDPYTLYQLGREAEGREIFAAAASLYARALPLTADEATWRHDLVIRHLYCLGRAGAVEEALDLAGPAMAVWSDSPDLFFVLGNLLLDHAMANPREALAHWLPAACAAWERCLEIGERADLEGSVSGRGSFLAQHNLESVRGQFRLLAA